VGGDEFVIVCHDILVEAQATRIAERVAAMVANPLLLDDERVVIRASIGIVLGRPGANPDALVNDAGRGHVPREAQNPEETPISATGAKLPGFHLPFESGYHLRSGPGGPSRTAPDRRLEDRDLCVHDL
jgi:hypothetical protein